MSKRSFSEAFKESQADTEILEVVDKISAMDKVLRLPDTLEVIFKFLDTKNLLKCRTVCRTWRTISTKTFKRQFNLKTVIKSNSLIYLGVLAHKMTFGEQAITFIGKEVEIHEDPEPKKQLPVGQYQDALVEEGEEMFVGADGMIHILEAVLNRILDPTIPPLIPLTVDLIGNQPDRNISTDHQCLLLQDHERNLLQQKAPWRRVKPKPWFMAAVLELDWLPSVRKLILDRCLTVDDWNAAANRIMAKFPGLTDLLLWLPQERNTLLPLVYTELEKESEVALPSLKKIGVHYVIEYDKPKPKCVQTRSKNPWLNAVRWDFLKHCKNLEVFEARIAFGRLETKKYLEANVIATRKLPSTTAVQGAWKLEIFDRKPKRSMTERSGFFVEYNSAVATDISNLVTFFKPTDLQLPFQPLLHSKLTPEVKDQVHSLGYNTLSTESPFGYTSPLLRFAATFKNLRKLNWIPFCEKSDSDSPENHLDHLPNLVTLMLTDTNSWMNSNLPEIAPNVELLVASFRVGLFRSGISDMLRVLRFANDFPNLKHLVLLAESHPSDRSNTAAFCHEIKNQCGRGLLFRRLKSFTTIIKHPVDLLKATKWCIKLLTPVMDGDVEELMQSQSLGVYKLNLEEAEDHQGEETDLDISTLNVPDHLTVRAASTRLLGIGEVKFEGMQNSYVTWPELCLKPQKQ